MPRIAKADVIAALERAANHIRAAASEDHFTSRSEMRRKLRDLQGIDRLLTDAFYRFVDHHDGKAGAQITESHIAHALSFVRSKMIDQYDLSRNGLSIEEIERVTKINRMAVQLARQLKRAAQQEADLHPAELADKLGELGQGLTFEDYASESSEELEPFFLEASLDQLSEDSFSEALGLDPADPRQVIERKLSAAGFFERFVDIQNTAFRPKAIELVEALKAYLYDLSVIIIGEDEQGTSPVHPVYIVGLNRRGSIVGLRSQVVWT